MQVIFAKREMGGNKILNLLLCELERYNGIVRHVSHRTTSVT